MTDDANTPLEDLRLFLAYLHGVEPHQVVLRGAVPGEDPAGYAQLVGEAVTQAWERRGGSRPLPPGYTPPHR